VSGRDSPRAKHRQVVAKLQAQAEGGVIEGGGDIDGEEFEGKRVKNPGFWGVMRVVVGLVGKVGCRWGE